MAGVLVNPLAVERLPKTGRVMRRPVHKWNVRHRPWALQPICIAPVIPGETLKNAVFQARVVTDPLKNRLIGWWHEYYWYYVPFRALAIADELTEMVVNPEWTSANVDSSTAVPQHYFAGRNSIDYVSACMDAIVAFDFRTLEETQTRKIDGLHQIDVNHKGLFHSIISDAHVQEWDVAVVDGPDAGSELNASEVDIAMEQYELLRSNGLIEMTYEDYLKTYGIKGKAVEPPEHQYTPELLRYVRDWQYPSNTINPTNGAAASAVSWSVAERIDKDRFFREPGFVVGFTVSRPKVYLANQVGNGTMMLDTIRRWLPKVMEDDPYTSLARFANGEGPLYSGLADTAPAASDATPTQPYWVDVRDLFLYGDQFHNYGTSEGSLLPNAANLPWVDGNVNYIHDIDAMCDKLFVDQSTKQHTEQDGLISFVIAGSQRDMTVDSRAKPVLL